MIDWQELVHQRLGALALDDADKDAVCAELAAHLEESYEVLCNQGLLEKEAVRRTLDQVSDWHDLRRKIFAAKRRQPMKKRAQQLWIPGLLTMAFSTIFLIVLRRQGFHPSVVSWHGTGGILLFVPWLVSLGVLGALGAYLSLRAGGSRGTVLLASVFPSVAFAGAILFMFLIGLLVEPILLPIVGPPAQFTEVATDIFDEGIGWIVVPGAALFVGGLLIALLFGLRSTSKDAAIS